MSGSLKWERVYHMHYAFTELLSALARILLELNNNCFNFYLTEKMKIN